MNGKFSWHYHEVTEEEFYANWDEVTDRDELIDMHDEGISFSEVKSQLSSLIQ